MENKEKELDFDIDVVLNEKPMPMPTGDKLAGAILGTGVMARDISIDSNSDFGGYADELTQISSNLILDPIYIPIAVKLDENGNEIVPNQSVLKEQFNKKQADNTILPETEIVKKVIKKGVKELKKIIKTKIKANKVEKKVKKEQRKQAQKYADRLVPPATRKIVNKTKEKPIKVPISMPKELIEKRRSINKNKRK